MFFFQKKLAKYRYSAPPPPIARKTWDTLLTNHRSNFKFNNLNCPKIAVKRIANFELPKKSESFWANIICSVTICEYALCTHPSYVLSTYTPLQYKSYGANNRLLNPSMGGWFEHKLLYLGKTPNTVWTAVLLHKLFTVGDVPVWLQGSPFLYLNTGDQKSAIMENRGK